MNEFHMVRRVLRAVAPDYRLLASNELEAGESVLDVKLKTIEVAETNPSQILDTVAALLFQIGHLLLRKNPAFALFFGEGIRDWKGEPEALVAELARLGVKADRAAATWATAIFDSYSYDTESGKERIEQQMWKKEDWIEYFSNA